MSYLEPILVHPVRRQNFGDGVAQTCNPHLIPCPKLVAYGDEDGCGDGGGVAGGKGRRNPCGASRWQKMGVVAPSRLS